MSNETGIKPTGSRRFWIAILCFAIVNAAAWVGYRQWDHARRDHVLRVEQFTPSQGATVVARPTLTWTFNLDVGTRGDVDPLGTLSPPAAGKWHWADARTLEFMPTADLARATPYTVTLDSKRLRTPGGFGLDTPFTASFHTSSLAVESISQNTYDASGKLIIELAFNDPVIPADVMAHLKVADPLGNSLPVSPHGIAKGNTVWFNVGPVTADHVDITLASGLAGQSGPLGLAATVKRTLPIGSQLLVKSVEAEWNHDEFADLDLQFNNPIDAGRLREVVSVDPPTKFTIEGDSRYFHLVGDFKPATRYAVTLGPPPSGGDQAQYPRKDVLSVFVPDRPSAVWFDVASGYLGANGHRAVMAHAINMPSVDVSVYRLYDVNLVSWRNDSSGWRSAQPRSLGRAIATRHLRLDNKRNVAQALPIKLDDLIPADAHDGVYEICIGQKNTDADPDDDPSVMADTVVTLSDIGLCAHTATAPKDGLTIWAVSLSSAAPETHAHIRVYSNKGDLLGEAQTDASGLAHIAPIHPGAGESPALVIADRDGTQLTWLDLRQGSGGYGDASTTGQPYLRDGCQAMIYTDRGVYRPGETVYLRAIVRGPDDQTPPAFPVVWQIRRPDLHPWQSLSTTLDRDGAAEWKLTLPADLPTGRWTAQIGLGSDSQSRKIFGTATFLVEQFMPNRLKLSVALQGKSLHSAMHPDAEPDRAALGDPTLTLTAQADYLFGRPAANCAATLAARIDPIAFYSSRWDGFIFSDSGGTTNLLSHAQPLGRRVQLPAITLDANGKGKWGLDVPRLLHDADAAPDPVSARRHGATEAASVNDDAFTGPWRLSLATSVVENGGRAITASRALEIDGVPYYIGVKGPSSASVGSPTTFSLAAVRPNGDAADVDSGVELTLYRMVWNSVQVDDHGRYHYESEQTLERVSGPLKVTLQAGRGQCDLTPPVGGMYVVRVVDSTTRAVSSRTFYGQTITWDDNISRQNPRKIELVVLPAPDGPLAKLMRRSPLAFLMSKAPSTAAALADSDPGAPIKDVPTPRLHVGSKALVLVRSPFAGRLLLTIETDGVVSARVIDMPRSQMAVPIEITDACRPNAFITATVIRAIDPSASWRPHRAMGVTRLCLDNNERRLDVRIVGPPEMRPENTLQSVVRITDASGQPVADAAVSVAAVDEGICQLTDFRTPDPLAFFTAPRALGVTPADIFDSLMPEVQSLRQSDVGGGMSSSMARYRMPMQVTRVRSVALVSPIMHTDAQGLAMINLQVPQFAGQLRVMAVAYDQQLFGSSQKTVYVRSPLLVQSSWPRFAAPGDRFDVPLVVFNNTSSDGVAHVHIELSGDAGKINPLRAAGARGDEIDLPGLAVKAGGQATASVSIDVAQAIGAGHARLVATLNDQSYHEEIDLPVRGANPTISQGGYAVAAPGAAADVSVPLAMLPGAGHFRLNVTQRPTLQLPQGLDYLDRYPYGCVEQTTSACFPLVYLQDLGKEIDPRAFGAKHVEDRIQAGITQLTSMQTADGGLAMWPGGTSDWAWGTVYAAHFLVVAKEAGHSIPHDFYDQVLSYVRSQLNQSCGDGSTLDVQAYACYVLALAGQPDRAAMSRLDELTTRAATRADVRPWEWTADCGTARLHLAAAWLAAGRRDRAEGLLPRDMPQPRAQRRLDGAIASDVSDLALLIDTLLSVEPDRPDLPALVQKLANEQHIGQWSSTQDNAMAVMALGHYLRQSHAAEPYLTAELRDATGSLAIASAGNPIHFDAVALPGAEPILASFKIATTQPASDLSVAITGPKTARGYISWLRVGVPVGPIPEADRGIKVRRRYLDESGKPLGDRAVHSGDIVQVELTLSAGRSINNVVVEDMLPAGLEPENTQFKTSMPAEMRNDDDARPAGAWSVDHVEALDDRVVLMGRLSSGDYKYVYLARAVAPGVFVVPPVRAECMYDESINSIANAGGKFRVEGNGPQPIARLE